MLVLGGAARWGRFEKNLAQGEGRGARTVEGLHSASVTSILAKLESGGCPRDSKSIEDSTQPCFGPLDTVVLSGCRLRIALA